MADDITEVAGWTGFRAFSLYTGTQQVFGVENFTIPYKSKVMVDATHTQSTGSVQQRAWTGEFTTPDETVLLLQWDKSTDGHTHLIGLEALSTPTLWWYVPPTGTAGGETFKFYAQITGIERLGERGQLRRANVHLGLVGDIVAV